MNSQLNADESEGPDSISAVAAPRVPRRSQDVLQQNGPAPALLQAPCPASPVDRRRPSPILPRPSLEVDSLLLLPLLRPVESIVLHAVWASTTLSIPSWRPEDLALRISASRREMGLDAIGIPSRLAVGHSARPGGPAAALTWLASCTSWLASVLMSGSRLMRSTHAVRRRIPGAVLPSPWDITG